MQLTNEQVTACLTTEDSSFDITLMCPCGSQYTHIKKVGTLLGGDEGAVYPGTTTIGNTAARRSALQIEFSCEMCGGQFWLTIQQHKGCNVIKMHYQPMNDSDDPEENKEPSEPSEYTDITDSNYLE